MALVCSESDADEYLSKRRSGPALALSPAVFNKLETAGVYSILDTDLYLPGNKSNVCKRAAKNENLVREALRHVDLRSSAVSFALEQVVSRSFSAGRLWEILNSRTTWFAKLNGAWRITSDIDAVFLHTLKNMKLDTPEVNFASGGLLAASISGISKWISIRRLLKEKFIAVSRPRLHFRLDDLLDAQGTKLLVVRECRSIKSEFTQLFDILRCKRQVYYSVGIVGGLRKPRRLIRSIEMAIRSIDDGFINAIIGQKEFFEDVANFHKAASECEVLFRKCTPSALVMYQVNNQLGFALSDAAASAGVKRIIIQHNSVSSFGANNEDKAYVLEYVVRTRFGGDDGSQYWCWSPIQLNAISTILSKEVRALAFRGPNHLPEAPIPDRQRPVVLYADNYMEWKSHLPFVMQTSNELYKNIAAMVELAKSFPMVDFKIRLKSKGELNRSVISRSLTLPANVELLDTSLPIEADILSSTLLIASCSTTIEQALQLRVPVLLWGEVLCYQHLRADFVPPTSGERSPVYAVAEVNRLRDMLKGIISAHFNSPLSDEELRGLVWARSVPKLEEICASALAIA